MARVLIACESSGTVREAFRRRGHDAWSCDLLPADDGSPHHIQGDALDAIRSQCWSLVIAHPPCTHLSVSGLHWNARVPGRAEKTEAALQFVRDIIEAGRACGGLVVENPVSCISSRIRRPDQIIQPWQFGEDASKATCLWLHGGVPALRSDPRDHFPPRVVMVGGKPRNRWSNQTDGGQNRLGPSPTRWKERSRTYPGIAQAMAKQWGSWLYQRGE